MPTEEIDANQVENPSPSTETPPAEGQQPPEQPAAEPSLADAAREAYEQAQPESQEEEVPETEEALPPEEPAEPPTDEVPFHEHPRWQEVTKKNKDLEAKVKEYEGQHKEFEAASQRVQYHDAFMQQHGISNEDFGQVMSFLALRQVDPAQARSLLKPFWDSLAAFDENNLSPDIQSEVAKIEQAVKDGEISRPLAERSIQLLRDANKARVQQESAKKRTQMTAEQQHRAIAQNIGATLRSWEQATAAKDPSYKPKTNGARDGLYELTVQKYSFLASRTPPRNGAEASQLAEQAYKEAKEFLAPAKTVTKPQLRSSSSSTARRNGEDLSVAGTVAAVAAKHGYNWRPPKR